MVASDALLKRIETACSHKPFCFKDPRFASTIQVWRPFLGDVVYLCIFRDPATTVASIIKECEARLDYMADVAMTPEWALEVWISIYRNILIVNSLCDYNG